MADTYYRTSFCRPLEPEMEIALLVARQNSQRDRSTQANAQRPRARQTLAGGQAAIIWSCMFNEGNM